MATTPDDIAELGDNEVFVFGSNLLGIHGAGAAKVARERFGAELGVGEGLMGRCYAFPTVTSPMMLAADRKLRRDRLEEARDKLFETAHEMPGTTFFLTKVGCGLAGFTEEEMASLFHGSQANIIKPAGW